jgi:hypothetical protein
MPRNQISFYLPSYFHYKPALHIIDAAVLDLRKLLHVIDVTILDRRRIRAYDGYVFQTLSGQLSVYRIIRRRFLNPVFIDLQVLALGNSRVHFFCKYVHHSEGEADDA